VAETPSAERDIAPRGVLRSGPVEAGPIHELAAAEAGVGAVGLAGRTVEGIVAADAFAVALGGLSCRTKMCWMQEAR